MAGKTRVSVWWIVVPVVAAVAYLVLRTFIDGQYSPYATEIAAAFLGSLLTIAVTGLLIQRQAGQTSAAELQKEKAFKVYEERIAVYRALMDSVRALLVKESLETSDQINLQIQFQQLAFVAGAEVLDAAGRCIQVINTAAEDGVITASDRELILQQFAQVVLRMRSELALGETANEDSVTELVGRSLEFAQWEKGEREFLKACSPAERDFYSQLIDGLKKRGVGYKKQTVGIAVRDAQGRSIAHLYPTGAGKKPHFLIPASADGSSQIEQVLAQHHHGASIDPLADNVEEIAGIIVEMQGPTTPTVPEPL